MPDPVETLLVELLEWLGSHPKPYREVMEAWRTSCPRLPVWEEANARGFLERQVQDSQAMVAVSALGAKFLSEHQRRVIPPSHG
jgi:hypothetical protein